MSAAGNAAEQAENMTLWVSEKLSIKQEGKNNNNNYNNNTMSNTNKYIAPASIASPKMCPSSSSSGINNNNSEFDEICKKVRSGYKIMIIMRGAPGSGKTTLARSLLQQCQLLDQNAVQDFVFSSDEYFLTQRGYQFNRANLTDAHEWNKERVKQKAAAGWGPIIVDNTNTMIWEMLPYVQIGVQHGYTLELLEPQTSWARSATKLSQMNVHQVPKENIQRMLDNYERASVVALLRETKYKVSLPQLRLQPPLPALTGPKEQPTQAEHGNNNAQVEAHLSSNVDGFKLNANAKNWVPYEKNAPNYWAQLDEQKMQIPVAAPAAVTGKNTLVDLLRDEQSSAAAPALTTDVTCETLQRHSINCPNESTGFVMLRQMYPNKQLPGLWDLYVKCNGDVDWAVDILLKEDELNGDAADAATADYADHGAFLLQTEQFQCSCNNSDNNILLQASTTSALSTPILSKCHIAKPQRQPRSRRNVSTNSGNNNLNKQLQVHVENCFVLGDDQYSEHTRKIRDIRNGILDQPLPLIDTTAVNTADDDDEDSEDNSLLEMEFNENLIDQLCSNFHSEEEMLLLEPEVSPIKVFVPRQLAKQLYMVLVEAKHHQLEEQRQQTLRDDEQFARLLKHPKYADYTESPSNVNELLDMELALSIYNSEQQAASEVIRQKPNDIATYLTKMKLCEKFPNIPTDSIHEIFAATENNYVKTIEILGSGLQSELTAAQLYEQALQEREKLNAEERQEEHQQPSGKTSSPRLTANNAKAQSPQLHEEAKSAALRDFEETRNLAAHHSQLRAECYLKAKQAIQQGNGSVALYYSEIAQLHKKKNDVLNHRAANCIMEVHKHTQNNPDLLDLHYLHTTEAVSCLDLFLDRHITVLRNCTRVYKHLFIITGRGLHSANGVSTIKKRVKARLGERRLRWQEVNPGLLRVKVFSASRHSKNF